MGANRSKIANRPNSHDGTDLKISVEPAVTQNCVASVTKMANLQSVGFEDMPNEIVLQIFKHLKFHEIAASSQVCKRWKLLTEDQSLWQKVDCWKVPTKFIEKALRHGCQYLSLWRTQIKSVSDPSSFSV